MFDEKEWSGPHVITGVNSKNMESFHTFWGVLLEECSQRLQADGGDAPSALARQRALLWLSLATKLFGGDVTSGTADGEAALQTAADGSAAPAGTGARARASSSGKVASAALRPEERLDLDAQGATHLSQLVRLSVSMQLAHKAQPAEYEGAVYGSSLDMAAAIKRASKTRSPLLNDLLREGEITGEITMVERHIDKTVNRLMSDSADLFFMAAGSRLTQVWSKAKSTLNTAQACRYLISTSICAEVSHG